ncbi:MAG: hypothetical protein R3A79_09325 [Nannocystaceae bacterium]
MRARDQGGGLSRGGCAVIVVGCRIARAPRSPGRVTAALLLSPGLARADVLPVPVPMLNAFLFGPAGIVVLAGIVAVGVLLYRGLRRRGRGKGFAIGAAIGACLAIDFAAYVVSVTLVRRPAYERSFPGERVEPAVDAAAATAIPEVAASSTAADAP